MSTETLTARIAAALGDSVYAGRPGHERDAWLHRYADIMCRTLDLDPDWCGPVVALTPELSALIETVNEDNKLLSSIWLYVDWRYVTKQLTTAQKERWLAALKATHDAGFDAADWAWWRS